MSESNDSYWSDIETETVGSLPSPHIIQFCADSRVVFEIDLQKRTCRFADGVTPEEGSAAAWKAFFNAFPGALDLAIHLKNKESEK